MAIVKDEKDIVLYDSMVSQKISCGLQKRFVSWEFKRITKMCAKLKDSQ